MSKIAIKYINQINYYYNQIDEENEIINDLSYDGNTNYEQQCIKNIKKKIKRYEQKVKDLEKKLKDVENGN